MAYKRRFKKSRRFGRNYRRKATIRRRIPKRVPRFMYPKSNTNYLRVARWQPADTQSFGGTNASFNSAYFQIGVLSDLTGLATLFDQYKILKVTARWRAISNPECNTVPGSSSIANAANVYADIIACVDHDDNLVAGSMDALAQYSKSKTGVLKPDRWFYYTFHPTPSTMIYQDGVSTAYAVTDRRQWMDLAYTGIRHYGLKWGIDCRVTPSGQSFNYEWQYKIHAIFKSLR